MAAPSVVALTLTCGWASPHMGPTRFSPKPHSPVHVAGRVAGRPLPGSTEPARAARRALKRHSGRAGAVPRDWRPQTRSLLETHITLSTWRGLAPGVAARCAFGHPRPWLHLHLHLQPAPLSCHLHLHLHLHLQWQGLAPGVPSCPEPPGAPSGGAGAERRHGSEAHSDQAGAQRVGRDVPPHAEDAVAVAGAVEGRHGATAREAASQAARRLRRATR
eukprot:scaffold93674_cov48-Phaeocystis_antarctica.AAC.1